MYVVEDGLHGVTGMSPDYEGRGVFAPVGNGNYDVNVSNLFCLAFPVEPYWGLASSLESLRSFPIRRKNVSDSVSLKIVQRKLESGLFSYQLGCPERLLTSPSAGSRPVRRESK